MKIRITLTIDPAVSHLAKQRAKARGTSVSGLVEQLLRDELQMEAPADGRVLFSERWTGKARLNGRSDRRAVLLRKKYGG